MNQGLLGRVDVLSWDEDDKGGEGGVKGKEAQKGGENYQGKHQRSKPIGSLFCKETSHFLGVKEAVGDCQNEKKWRLVRILR